MTGVPRSLTGHVLLGDNAVKFIFMDEAGSSGAPEERVCIVAAVIVDADKQMLHAEALLDEAFSCVPSEFRDGFVFHAEDIMNNPKYRDRWRLTDRVNLLVNVMSIPRKLRMPIAGGLVWAKSPTNGRDIPTRERIFVAFANALSRADKNLRSEPNVIGTIVAERSDVQKEFGGILIWLREQGFVAGPGHLTDRDVDIAQGYNSQDGVMKVTRIRRTIHFVGKGEDDLVWLADACAYGLKRYFAGLPFGDKFGEAIHGNSIHLPDYQRGPSSGILLVP